MTKDEMRVSEILKELNAIKEGKREEKHGAGTGKICI